LISLSAATLSNMMFSNLRSRWVIFRECI
jgi:hypothetical protein